MNASTTFDTAAAIAAKLAVTYKAVLTDTNGTPGLVPDTAATLTDAEQLAAAFPADRKSDVCRLLAEALKEKANRNGLSASATLTKALDGAKNFSDLELASLKAFWQLAVVADSAVNK